MDKRKELILDIVIKEHIKSGTPVGSSIIAGKYKLGVSPATVRNDMVDLENEGLIVQPYTSAGRIPTEKAYLFYLNKINRSKLKGEDINEIDKVLTKKEETDFKQVAKLLARMTDNAVFWAFSKDNLYYTGISNLLSQPEFNQIDMIYDISVIIDRLDEIIGKIFNKIKSGTQVLIGSHNPFSNFCSTILAKYRHKEHDGLIGIIGPMRMNYEKNLALINFINNKLSHK